MWSIISSGIAAPRPKLARPKSGSFCVWPLIEEQHVVAVVVRDQDAARADVDDVLRVGRHRAEREEVDRLGERADAVATEVLGGDRGDGRRRGGADLGRLGGGDDDVLVEQPLELARVGRRRGPPSGESATAVVAASMARSFARVLIRAPSPA